MAAVERSFSGLVGAWYDHASWLRLLAPLAWLYGMIARRNRLRYLTGRKEAWRAPVPLIVVGNVTAGGTGKTPFVIWLAAQLQSLGFRPGIVSRGYGGTANRKPTAVAADTPTDAAGDEAPLIAARTGCPVVIAADRVAATKALLATTDVDIVISDDGLQHYALARDVEIVLVDGYRGLGNGRMLPAGPLREPAGRLEEVDWLVSTGMASGLRADELLMEVRPLRFVPVPGSGPADARPIACEDFVRMHRNVNAVAGVGNPLRFAGTLRSIGLNPMLVPLADHHRYSGHELQFDNSWPIVCTEKDATKLRELNELPEQVYYLEIGVGLTPCSGLDPTEALKTLLRAHGISRA